MRDEANRTADEWPDNDVVSAGDLSEQDFTERMLEAAENQREEQGGFGVEKNISVIFATIGGFEVTSTASMDEIEEVSLRKQQLNNELDRIISKYGGVIDKIQGSFFMADFGTKVTNADDPACAVLAAMEMIEAVEGFPGTDIHIGINSGMAWVGEIGTGKQKDVTVMGPTVNLGARVKTIAERNQVVVSPNTYELTKQIFTYKALPPAPLKGIAQPVPVYAVTGKTTEAERITVVKESEEERQKRLQEAIPEYLRQKINASRSTIEGERKMVTMLYSDLSGFTALSEKFKDDPGTMALLMDRCHRTLGQVIYKYEGVIDRIVGDALMAIFGAPIAHEDDPERAVQAGLEMLAEIKHFSQQMAVEMGMPPLDVHIGVNTGKISIGNISTDAAAKMDYTVIGEPVELAEKLEDISEAGEMLVADRTYRLTRALFDYERKADVEVGGKRVPIYKVCGKKSQPQLKRGVAALNEVFVARDHELRLLTGATDSLFQNKGHFVCVIGQAGLGKSRLKRELKAELAEKVSWFEGVCFAHTEQTAYSVFIAAIKAYLDVQENDSNEEIAEKLIFKVKNLFRNADEDVSEEIIPYIGSQLLSLHFDGARGEKIRYLDAEGRRQRTFAAMKDLLVAESKRRPVVLALDDLHWIDQVSLDLIFFLMENVIDERILLLSLYRPERTDLCWKIGEQAAIRIPEHFTPVTLERLTSETSRELLDGLLTLENAEQLKNRILEKAGGNPFYMEEVLRSLIDDQMIVKVHPDDPADSRWIVNPELQEIREVNIPDSLELMMEARIDRMPYRPKTVLQHGAIIGRTFEHDLLQSISPSLGDLEASLSHLIALDMVSMKMPPTDPLQYIFGHIVTHDITYAAIPVVRRRYLHTQVGTHMESKHHEHLERIYEQLARHYHNGSDAKKAAIYLAKAGKKAKHQYNNQVALTFYQQGLGRLRQLGEPMPEEQREIHEGLGDVYTILGEFDAAVESYTEALESEHKPRKRAELKRNMANVYEKRSENDIAMTTLESALSDLETQPDAAEEAQVYNLMGWLHFRKGDLNRAIEFGMRALNLIEGVPRLDVMAAIDKNLGSYYYYKGEPDRANRYFQEGMERANQIGDKLLLSQFHNNIGAAHRLAARPDAALESLEKSIEIKEQLGYLHGLGQSYINVGMVHSERGNFDLALDYFERLLKIGQRTAAPKTVADAHSRMGIVFWRKADAHHRAGDTVLSTAEFDQAIEHHHAALNIHEEITDVVGQAQDYANLTDAHLGKDELEAARQFTLKGLELAKKLDMREVSAGMYNNIGRIEKRQGHWAKAREHFQTAAEFAEGAGAMMQLAAAYRNIGEVCLEIHEREQAKGFFQKALAFYEQQKNSAEVEKIKVFLQQCNAVGSEPNRSSF